MTVCSRPVNTLFVHRLACLDFPLHLSAHSSFHYIAEQWLYRPRQIHPFLQNTRLRLLRKLLSHPSLITKTGIAILDSGLLAAAIAKMHWFIFPLNSSPVM